MTFAAASPPLPLHIGFTGTRHGMSDPQRRAVAAILSDLADIHRVPIVAHHGLDIEGDGGFNALCRERGFKTIGHSMPFWPDDKILTHFKCDQILPPPQRMKRTSEIGAAIVSASHIVIAAPPGAIPWPPGDIWDTIGAASRALRRGTLEELHIFGPDGEILDHARWRL